MSAALVAQEAVQEASQAVMVAQEQQIRAMTAAVIMSLMVLAVAEEVLVLLDKQLQVITREQVVMVVMVLLLQLQALPLQEVEAVQEVQIPSVQPGQVAAVVIARELLIQVAEAVDRPAQVIRAKMAAQVLSSSDTNINRKTTWHILHD